MHINQLRRGAKSRKRDVQKGLDEIRNLENVRKNQFQGDGDPPSRDPQAH